MQQNTNTTSDSQYVTLQELCSWLKVKPSTIAKYRAKKLMPLARKPFGLLIWDKQEIQMWLDSQQGN